MIILGHSTPYVTYEWLGQSVRMRRPTARVSYRAATLHRRLMAEVKDLPADGSTEVDLEIVEGMLGDIAAHLVSVDGVGADEICGGEVSTDGIDSAITHYADVVTLWTGWRVACAMSDEDKKK